eukprot:351207-Chlamydomonas_euryale.AAC.2
MILQRVSPTGIGESATPARWQLPMPASHASGAELVCFLWLVSLASLVSSLHAGVPKVRQLCVTVALIP